jgi:hypothetical protein
MIDKLPKRVFVGLYEFKLILCEAGDPRLVSESIDCDGLTELNERVIYLNKALPFKRFVNVVLHECIHTMNWSKDIEDGVTEEEFTENLANSFTDFWLDNPRLVLWLNRAFKQIRKEQSSE